MVLVFRWVLAFLLALDVMFCGGGADDDALI